MNHSVLPAIVLAAAACGPKAQIAAPSGASAKTHADAVSNLADFAQLSPIEGATLETDYTPEKLAEACDALEKSTDERLAELVAVPDSERTFTNSFELFETITADFAERFARLSFLKSVHTDEKVRAAASACQESGGKYAVKLGARKDLYAAMKAYLDGAGKRDALDAQQKRLIELAMIDFRRNGLELPDAKREELVKLRERLTELETKFSTNLDEDRTEFNVEASALAGMPKPWLEGRKKTANGAFILTTTYPDYYPVMENCSNAATRKKMQIAFMNRGGPENVKMLDEAVELRARAAHLLGYATHLDLQTEDRMAKDGKTVTAFLERMLTGLEPRLRADTAKMQKLEATAAKNPKAKIETWDWRYYMNQIRKRDHAIDDEEVRKYFPQDKVVAGMFAVYSRLFGVTFAEIQGAKVWASGVRLYEVHDVRTGRLLAKFYIDFYPRQGKYGHAAEFTLSQGHATMTGYAIPWASLVLNFAEPKDGKPAFQSLDEVETLFHEFGHVMHESLTTARYASQAGTNTSRDFVEAPSQMLENWVYQPEVLAMISADPKDPSKPMPAALAAKIVAARTYNAGVHYSRQLFLGTFDATIHTRDSASSDTVAKDLWAKIMHYEEDPAEHFAGTFGHMFGYDGGYYGYLWSEVYQADMFTKFREKGVLDEVTGRAYRDIILANGRTVEAQKLLEEFLGRAPSEKAFLESIGL